MSYVEYSRMIYHKDLEIEVDIDMSLRKDSFERILAFSKSEEAKNMDMETTRWPSDLAILCFYHVPFLQIFDEAVGRW